MEEVKRIFKDLELRRIRSNRFWLILNIISFILASAVIVLNLNMVRFNPFRANANNGDKEAMIRMGVFIAIVVLTSLSTLMIQIISMFVFRKRSVEYATKKENIRQEIRKYKDKSDDYKEHSQKERDMLLNENILNIIKK